MVQGAIRTRLQGTILFVLPAAPPMRHHTIALTDASTPEELARMLGIAPALLGRLVNAPAAELYTEHRIPKRGAHRRDEVRIVWEAREKDIADAHKAFGRRLDLFARELDRDFPSGCVHGYVAERSTRSNAATHCGNYHLLRADLHNFFPSITAARLASLFGELGFQPSIANLLAGLATIDGRLPLGLHASPLLANLCCRGLDRRLKHLAAQHACAYTRYADDLALSGNRGLPTRADMSSAVEAEGFALSERKYRETKRGQAHFVTGLSIADSNRPRIPKRFKHRLRQELHFAERFGLRRHLGRRGYSSYQSGINIVDGRLKYLASVEHELGARFAAQWKRVLSVAGEQPVYTTRLHKTPREVTLLIDEGAIDSPEGTILALACVVTEEPDAVGKVAAAVLRRFVADPYYAGRKNDLKKFGLHFAHAHAQLQHAFVGELVDLPVRAFVAYDFVDRHQNYKSAYLSLLELLLRRRFSNYDRSFVNVLIETNNQVDAEAKAAVSRIYEDLAAQNSRRPSRPPAVRSIGKDDPLAAVADYFVGVFGRYAERGQRASSDGLGSDRANFERLRDKYRLIHSVPAGRRYWRRRLFSPWPDGKPSLEARA